MKKICAILLLMVIALTMSACGPNSNYYNLKSQNFYYYKNQAFEINPYDLLSGTLKDNPDLKQLSNSVRKHLDKYYDVKVEYRLKGEQDYKQMPTTDQGKDTVYLKDNMIYAEDAKKALGNGSQYDIKIHFIDNETKSEKTMMNLIGVFTFIQSPANAVVQEKTVTAGDTVNLLDNIQELDAEGKAVDLTERYSIEYSVTNGDASLTVDEDGNVMIPSAGTYDVVVKLTQLLETSGADATASASETSGGSNAMVLTIVYSIKAE